MDEIVKKDLEIIIAGIGGIAEEIPGKVFLITGGSGFIGSWFCDVLNFLGAKIICVDDLSTGSLENISHLKNSKNFEFIQANISNFKTDKKIDYLVHMASIAAPEVYTQYPIDTLDVNVLGTRNVLEIAKEKNVKAFLYTSTSEVYGNPPDSMVPTPESYYGFVNPVGGRSMYDESKRCAEAYCISYFNKFGLPIRIARIFNTYGPRLDIKKTTSYGRALIKFIYQSLSNAEVTVYGDGTQTRSFCYITDTIIGLFKLLLTPKIDGQIVNIGNNNELSILELAEKIIQLSGSSSKITFHQLPKDDPLRRCPDLTLAKNILDYYPRVFLDDGLKRTIEWVKESSVNV